MAHLLFQTAFPGDLFLSIPLMKRIRAWDPGVPLVLACRPGLGEFFVNNGLADEVVEIDKRSGDGRARALKRLRDEAWDVAFVPHQSVRTALWMTRVKAQKKLGFETWWNAFVYKPRVVKPMHLPDALRQLALLTPLDPRLAEWFATDEVQDLVSPTVNSSPLSFADPKVPEWASMKVKEHRPEGKRIFLAPGSVWATKRWTLKGYEDLARLLIKRGYQVELVGSGQERELCEDLVGKVPGVLSHAGRTSISGLVDLLTTGTALVCNDSGAMHAAAAADLPTVAVFGPTTLNLGFRPWQNRALVVQRELECRPCGKHGAEKCPIGTHACMETISAGDVLGALNRLLPA